MLFLYKKHTHEYPDRSITSTHSICIKFDFLERYGPVDIENMQEFSKPSRNKKVTAPNVCTGSKNLVSL